MDLRRAHQFPTIPERFLRIELMHGSKVIATLEGKPPSGSPFKKGKASHETELSVGTIIQDTDGVQYKILKRYQGRQHDDGYIATALGGSPHLVLAGSDYTIPYSRIDKVVKRKPGKPAMMARGFR